MSWLLAWIQMIYQNPDRCEKTAFCFLSLIRSLLLLETWVDEFYSSPDEVMSTRVVPCKYEDIYEFAKKRSALIILLLCIEKVRFWSKAVITICVEIKMLIFWQMLFNGCKAKNIGESLLFI